MAGVRTTRALLLTCLLGAPVLAWPATGTQRAAATSATPRFTLAAATPTSWTIRFTGQPLSSTVVSIGGKAHLLFSSNGIDHVGDPQLPVEVLSMGIPFGASLSVEISNAVYEEMPHTLVAPIPGYVVDARGVPSPTFVKNGATYSRDVFYPEQPVAVGNVYTLRGQHICPVRLFPYQYNPVTNVLRRMAGATFTVRMNVPAQGGSGGAEKSVLDPGFEDVFRGLVWNYDQAKAWRQSRPAHTLGGDDPTRNWFQTGQTYYRILIANDGWYRVTPSDIRAGGGAFPDPATFRLFCSGREVPFLVRSDSSMEFYGSRHYGDTTYYDDFTDTNAYWLTWGGPPGLRFIDQNVPPSGGAPVLSVPTTLHVEQNTALYRGATQQEIIDNNSVPGEAWIWEFYFPGSTITHDVLLDAVDYGAPAAASVRVRLYGTTSIYPPVQQSALLWYNDSLKQRNPFGAATFAQRTGGVFSFPIPVDSLRDGLNTLTIADTVSSPNQFYLDWFEIEYPRLLRAQNNVLVFSDSTGTGGNLLKFTVTGFSDSTIEVYDLQGDRRLLGGSVTGSPDTGYAIVFRDTLSGPKKYVVLVPSAAANLPVPITSKQFKDIRNNAQGADYIIISHRDFLAQAQQLAAHRASFNGVRTAVIDVQDIYDEFNYGIFSPVPIKSFLRYAYTQWPTPAPSSVLLFGDAIADFHHWLANSVKVDYVPAYGNPVSDNWFVSFDSTYDFLPSLLTGRLTVESPGQAQDILAKIFAYDNVQPAEWQKRSLFLTGGDDPGEQSQFNSLSDTTIARYITPPPLGGEPARIYKTSTAIIDSTRRDEINAAFTEGAAFVNFIGHSSGSIWSLDVGSPAVLGNTDGALPFVSSVSCNVSSFADQSVDNLSEQFVMAAGRGAIGMWGAVSLGYAYPGEALTEYFLSSMLQDSVRGFGALTTMSRLKLWEASNSLSDYITIALNKLTPLLGDPLTRMAIPRKPDLAFLPGDLVLDKSSVASGNPVPTLEVKYRNLGLVPADSVGLSLADLSAGQTNILLADTLLRPTMFHDSISVRLAAPRQLAKHTFTATLDPFNRIDEVTKANNIGSLEAVLSPSLLSFIRPLQNLVVPPAPYSLSATDPSGDDATAFQFAFQLDTSMTFDSPAMVSSPLILPGPVNGTWKTPALINGAQYFARVRVLVGQDTGSWSSTMFSAGANAPAEPAVRWEEGSQAQFAGGNARGTVAGDSGIVLAPGSLSGVFSSEPIPYAVRWDSLRWKAGGLTGGTTIHLSLVGFKASGAADTLRVYPSDSLAPGISFLGSVPGSASYTSLALGVSMVSASPGITPFLQQWSLRFEPPPDLAISAKTLVISGAPVVKGTPISLPVTVYNIGYSTSDSCTVVASVYDALNLPHPVAASRVDSISANSNREVVLSIPTDNLSGTVNVQVDVIPAAADHDLIPQNNTAHCVFQVTGGLAAIVQIFADGSQLMDGDYVSPHPRILVHLPGQDSSLLRTELLVDNILVSGGPGMKPDGPAAAAGTGQDPVFLPALSDGRHELRVRLFSSNLVGGEDSLDHAVEVNVLSAEKILRLFNYPNPFSRDTYFTFVLTGSQVPEDLTIRVFTVTGRKIRQIDVSPGTLQIGFNRIYWDGRDNDGDEIANGYYFYQVVIRSGGQSDAAIEKLVKLR